MIWVPIKAPKEKILMITPYHLTQRGNSITIARIRSGLTAHGYNIDLVSLENPRWRELLAEAISDSQYKLIHGFQAWHMGQLFQTCQFDDSIPIIITTTGTDIHYYLYNEQRAVVESALLAAQKIVIFNESFRAGILEILPQLDDKLMVIPQGVSLPPSPPRQRSDWGFDADDVIFLLPSGLRPVKNISLAINALARLHSDYPQVKLIIMGGVLDAEYGRNLLNQISCLSWITNLGEVSHQEIGAIMALGDIVLNTSWSEGQPQAALEAMSLGLPAIFTAVPGNLNLIQNGTEGFYVHDGEELYSSARYLLENAALRKSMGQNAKKLIQQRYNPEDEINAYERVYNLFIKLY